jgi:hypothetical protein
MSAISGRRRNRGTDRWITYDVVYATRDDKTISYAATLRDEIGAIPLKHEVQHIAFDRRAMTAEDAVRQAVCEFIDSTPLPLGEPLHPAWHPPASSRIGLRAP